MEKILINENQLAAGSALSQAEDAAAIINSKLTPALEAIGVQITDDIMKDCLLGGNQTRKDYFDAVAKDLKGTRTPSIKQQMQEAADEAFEVFERDLTTVRREARNYKFLTIVDGEAVLSAENEDKLRDQSRIYLTDPKEIEAYKFHVEIIEKLNQFFKGRVPFRWSQIFPEVGGVIVRNEDTIYSKLV